jgi:hypothetical protein
MKKTIFLLGTAIALMGISCKKNTEPIPEETPNPVTPTENYSSLADFYSKNGAPVETFTVNSANGGSFISQKSTTVVIPANAFQTNGIVTVKFRDIYSKSDMLLSNKPTNCWYYAPLVSAGEFFIKATINNSPAQLTGSVGINIFQPLNGPVDTAMKAFGAVGDSTGNFAWGWNSQYSVISTASNYIFSMYQFSAPVDSGSWCNSDNPTFFGTVPQTTLTANPTQTGYSPDVFLVFSGVKSMIHVYKTWGSSTSFPYNYAPVGYQCTLVAIGVKDGKLYSSFTPITISNNQTVNFTMSETTTEAFKTSLNALN